MTSTTLFKPLFAASIAAACGWAQAQAFDAVRMYGPPGDGQGTVGVALAYGYRYLGSDLRRTALFPALEYRWSNGWFAGTTNGIGYKFDSPQDMQFGLRMTADFGRSESRSPLLAGMGNIKARPEFGGFFNFYLARDINLSSSLRYGSGNSRKGAQLDLGAHYALQLAPQWRAAAGLSTTIANADYMQEHFGVTAAQALTSQNPAYSAGAGVRDVRASLSLNYFITPAWTVTGALSATSLQGDAKGSPIVRERTPISGVAALSYRF